MEFRNLGRSGLRVSTVGLGCNNFGMKLDEAGTGAVINAAIDAGFTLFDTADMYGGRGGSETHMGAVLGNKRKDIVLATKFGWEMDDEGLAHLIVQTGTTKTPRAHPWREFPGT